MKLLVVACLVAAALARPDKLPHRLSSHRQQLHQQQQRQQQTYFEPQQQYQEPQQQYQEPRQQYQEPQQQYQEPRQQYQEPQQQYQEPTYVEQQYQEPSYQEPQQQYQEPIYPTLPPQYPSTTQRPQYQPTYTTQPPTYTTQRPTYSTTQRPQYQPVYTTARPQYQQPQYQDDDYASRPLSEERRRDRDAVITSFTSQRNDDGASHAYTADNGLQREETIQLRQVYTVDEYGNEVVAMVPVVSGSFQFTLDDGTVVTRSYTTDETGHLVWSGSDLPQAPADPNASAAYAAPVAPAYQ